MNRSHPSSPHFSPPPSSLPALARYDRQIRLPGFGPEGQERLRRARVLVVGAGGLGAPIALYLAAAGVGTLGIADGDAVDLGNLHRQILYRESDLDTPKVVAAGHHLRALNREITVVTHPGWVRGDTVLDLVRGYDLVIDGTDTQTSRYLLNDATAMLGRPLIAGAVDRFSGMLSVFNLGEGPCYRCLFPQPAAGDQLVPCREAGVIGPVPGVIGSLQALEAIKLIVGLGMPLSGRLLSWDALTNQFTEFQLPRDPGCRLCSLPVADRRLLDNPPGEPGPRAERTEGPDGPACLVSDALWVDVRDHDEWRSGTLAGSRHIPLAELEARAGELPRDRPIVLFCRSGPRSDHGARLLSRLGFAHVRSLAGGLINWAGPLVRP